jgi:hypothetical protein
VFVNVTLFLLLCERDITLSYALCVIYTLDFWFRSGRTVFSIPLTLLMLFPVYLQFLFLKYNCEVLSRSQPDNWSAEHDFWKDPLQDQMYII